MAVRNRVGISLAVFARSRKQGSVKLSLLILFLVAFDSLVGKWQPWVAFPWAPLDGVVSIPKTLADGTTWQLPQPHSFPQDLKGCSKLEAVWLDFLARVAHCLSRRNATHVFPFRWSSTGRSMSATMMGPTTARPPTLC